MSDARWVDAERAAETAEGHFRFATRLYRAGGFEGPELDAYRARMGFMHAVQSAHTSLEGALLRILDLLGEERPIGERWHQDLIARVCRELRGPNARPPILSRALCDAIEETRRFHNLAMHGFDSFDAEKARQTVAAVETIAGRLAEEIAAFMRTIDGD